MIHYAFLRKLLTSLMPFNWLPKITPFGHVIAKIWKHSKVGKYWVLESYLLPKTLMELFLCQNVRSTNHVWRLICTMFRICDVSYLLKLESIFSPTILFFCHFVWNTKVFEIDSVIVKWKSLFLKKNLFENLWSLQLHPI